MKTASTVKTTLQDSDTFQIKRFDKNLMFLLGVASFVIFVNKKKFVDRGCFFWGRERELREVKRRILR